MITRIIIFTAVFITTTLQATILEGQNVNVFYNPNYMQIELGNDYAEASNLLSFLSTTDYPIKTFTDFDPYSLSVTLKNSDLIIFPELERGDLSKDLSPQSVSLIKNFVKNGGGLIITGIVAPNDANTKNGLNLLNKLFGFSLASGKVAFDGKSTKHSDVIDTEFESYPPTIANNNTVSLITSDLPQGSKRIYINKNVDKEVSVAVMPFGAGKIGYIGWSYWNSFPTGVQDNGWLDLTKSMIDEVRCEAPIARAIKDKIYHIPNSGVLHIDPESLNSGSSYCTEEISIILSRNNFTCKDIGEQEITFIVRDKIGRSDQIKVKINIADGNNYCLSQYEFQVYGKILDLNNNPISNIDDLKVSITKNGNIHQEFETINGEFVFQNLTGAQDYELIFPTTRKGKLNNLSVSDCHLIMNHILDIDPFDNFYQYISADVNKDGAIDILDVTEILSIILQKETEFSTGIMMEYISTNISTETNIYNLSPVDYGHLYPILAKNQRPEFYEIQMGDVSFTSDLDDNSNLNRNSFQITAKKINTDLVISIPPTRSGQFKLYIPNLKGKNVKAEGLLYSIDGNNLNIVWAASNESERSISIANYQEDIQDFYLVDRFKNYVFLDQSTQLNLQIDRQIKILEEDLNRFSLHPNPFINEIKVTYGGKLTLDNYSIFNNMGQKVVAKPLNNNTIKNLNVLPPGTYFVQIQADNHTVFTQKIVKK